MRWLNRENSLELPQWTTFRNIFFNFHRKKDLIFCAYCLSIKVTLFWTFRAEYKMTTRQRLSVTECYEVIRIMPRKKVSLNLCKMHSSGLRKEKKKKDFKRSAEWLLGCDWHFRG